MGDTIPINAGTFFQNYILAEHCDKFHILFRDIQGLAMRWNAFKKLNNETLLDYTLTNVAETYFTLNHLDTVSFYLIFVSRLTDEPENKKGDQNFSIYRLPDWLKVENCVIKVRSLLNDLKTLDELQRIRKWRNKEGAHLDYEIVCGEKPSNGTQILMRDVSSVVMHLSKIVAAAVGQDEPLDLPSKLNDEVDRLIAVLRAGLKALSCDSEELEHGQ